jgi:hypothetical protein
LWMWWLRYWRGSIHWNRQLRERCICRSSPDILRWGQKMKIMLNMCLWVGGGVFVCIQYTCCYMQCMFDAVLSVIYRNMHFTVRVFVFINPIFDSQIVCPILQVATCWACDSLSLY